MSHLLGTEAPKYTLQVAAEAILRARHTTRTDRRTAGQWLRIYSDCSERHAFGRSNFCFKCLKHIDDIPHKEA